MNEGCHGRPLSRLAAPLLAAVLTTALAATLTGCASAEKAEAAPASPGDVSATNKERLRAIAELGEQLRAGQSTDTDLSITREALKKAIWSRSSVNAVRIAALDALLIDERNAADTRKMLALLLPTESASREWEMIDTIGDRAADRGWTDLAPALVVSWSRPVGSPTDDKRPERIAIERLFPDRTAEQVVFDVFSATGENALDERNQLAAWGLLRRIDRGRTTELLRTLDPNAPGASPLVKSIARSARELGAVPDTADQLRWLDRLAAPDHAALWSAAASAIASLTEDQRAGLELRHASPIAYTAAYAPDRLRLSTDQALDAVAQRLKGRTIYRRAKAGTSRYDETLRTARAQLVWGDAISILIAIDALENPSLVAGLFEQADADRADTSTEHGGAFDFNREGTITARTYDARPNERLGDRQFVASHDLIDASDESLFHYHFHAASAKNSDYAGPSDADIKYASEHGRSCLVITSLSADKMDVDWYRGNGAAIDLGAITRPGTKAR
jgi:hypothetical protein